MSRLEARVALVTLAMFVSSTVAFAQEVKHIPLVPGLTLVSATQLPSGDQENVVTVGDVSAQGAGYGWTFRTQSGKAVETDGPWDQVAGGPLGEAYFLKGDALVSMQYNTSSTDIAGAVSLARIALAKL